MIARLRLADVGWILVTNLFVLAGVVVWGWPPGNVFLLFWVENAGLGVATQFASGVDEISGDGGQQALRRRAIDQQGLGRAADGNAAHLGVQGHAAGDVEVCGGVQIGVTQALKVA